MSLRHNDILDIARRDGKVTVDGLAAHFDVTLQTIRRDLTDLADSGRLQRVHGGAVLPSGVANIGYEDRRRLNDDAKTRIGRSVAEQIADGSSVFLGIGTTAESVARALVHHDRLMVVTNNLNAVPILSANRGCQVLVTGGTVRTTDFGLVGPMTVTSLRNFKFDVAVIGCSALDSDGTLFDYDLDEVMVSQAALSVSRTRILAADVTKFSRTAPARVADLTDFTLFCTDAPPELTNDTATPIILAD